MGATWERAEQLALELAWRAGKVRRVENRQTGEIAEAGNVVAYLEEAIRRENARIERQLAREQAADDDTPANPT